MVLCLQMAKLQVHVEGRSCSVEKAMLSHSSKSSSLSSALCTKIFISGVSVDNLKA